MRQINRAGIAANTIEPSLRTTRLIDRVVKGFCDDPAAVETGEIMAVVFVGFRRFRR